LVENHPADRAFFFRDHAAAGIGHLFSIVVGDV
jgi:hypothetical protein